MSNRADFLDMREQEAFENTQDIQRPVEKNLFDWCNEKQPRRKGNYKHDLFARAKDYEAAKKRKQLQKYGDVDAEFIDRFYNRNHAQLKKALVYHHHAKPLTDVEKLQHIAELSKTDREERISKMKEGFKKLRNE